MSHLRTFFAAVVFSVCSTGVVAQEPTIKIAHIDTFSGPMASVGATTSKTLRFAVDLVNERGGVLGRQLEVVSMDNGGQVSKAITLFRSVVDQDIDFMVQASSSSIAAGLLSAVKKNNARNPDARVLFLNYGSQLPELTGDQCSFWFFRFEAHQTMKMKAIAEYVAQNPDIENIYLINQDYSFGHRVSEDAKQFIGKARPEVEFVGDVFHPFGKVKDFAPYIRDIQNSGADTVITGNWGNDLALLIRAARNNGLEARFITYYGGLYGVPTAIGAAGEDILYQISSWHPNVPVENGTPKLEKYQIEFKKRYGEDLYYTSIVVQTLMLAKAIEQAGSATDLVAIAKALEGMEYDSPFGTIKMRKSDHQATHPLYISRLTKGVKYDAEELGMGWKTVAKVPGPATEMPSDCQMKRPE